MTEHSRRTGIFAERLNNMGMTVSYPGLSDHPDHKLLSELYCEEYGYGGILTIDMGTIEQANELLDLLQKRVPIRLCRGEPGLLRHTDVLLGKQHIK